RFVEEHLDETGLPREVSENPLDDDRALEALGSDHAREEDLAHSPRGELVDERVAADRLLLDGDGRLLPVFQQVVAAQLDLFVHRRGDSGRHPTYSTPCLPWARTLLREQPAGYGRPSCTTTARGRNPARRRPSSERHGRARAASARGDRAVGAALRGRRGRGGPARARRADRGAALSGGALWKPPWPERRHARALRDLAEGCSDRRHRVDSGRDGRR